METSQFHPSRHEVEVVLLEGGVDLEGDLLHNLTVVGVLDDEEVLGVAAVFACLEVEGAAEGALCVLLADFVGDDLLDVADDVAVGVGEVDVEVRWDEAGADGLELVEVQAEAHVADLVAGAQQVDAHGLHGVLLGVFLVGSRVGADVPEVDDGHDYLLQAGTAVDEVQAAALDLQADLLARRKGFVGRRALQEAHGQQVLGLGVWRRDDVAAGLLDDLVLLEAAAGLAVLRERLRRVEEAVVGGQQDTRAGEFIDDDAHEVLELGDGLLAGGEDLLVVRVAGRVDGVVVDVDDVHAAHLGGALTALHADEVRGLEGDALGIGSLEHGIAVRCIGGLAVGEHGEAASRWRDRQLLVRQQGGHAELRDAREHGLAARELDLARDVALELLCERRGDFVAHGVRDDDEDAARERRNLVAVERLLLGHFLYLAVGCEVMGAVLRPILAEICEIAFGIRGLDNLRELLVAVVESRRQGGLEELGERSMELPVVGVHAVVVARVGVPDLLRARQVEACCVAAQEVHHVASLDEGVVAVFVLLVPEGRPAALDDLHERIRVQEVVDGILQEFRQDDGIDAGEEVKAAELAEREVLQPVDEVERALDALRDGAELAAAHAVHPL